MPPDKGPEYQSEERKGPREKGAGN
jgi:hypothetical protein